MRQLTFIVAGDPNQFTGGYIYDTAVVEGLRAAGWSVELLGLDGRFPDADVIARAALDRALAATADDTLVVVDGLAMGGLPEVIQAHRDRLCIVCLLHHPLADEHGISRADAARLRQSERAALAAAHSVIVTSGYIAARLADYDVAESKIDIVEPGVERVPAAIESVKATPPRLLCIASVIPRKGHLVLVDALGELIDLDWHCECIGALDRDARHAGLVQARIEALQLADRISLAGAQPPDRLGAAYRAATLFVLPSFFEGYGMVVTEALTYGLPVVATTGGALVHTVPGDAGLLSAPGDAKALAANLRRMLENPQTLADKRLGAERARATLKNWTQQAARFAQILETRGEVTA